MKAASTSLTFRGYGVQKDTISSLELDALRGELTVEPYIPGAPVIDKPRIKMFMESSKKIYIPKCFGYERYGQVGDNRISCGETRVFEFKGSLRQEQEDVVNIYTKHVESPNNSGGIINLGCGCGKTVIGLYIASQLKVKTLIVAHKEFLIEQWRQRIAEFLPDVKVGLIKAKVIDVEDKDIVLASLQSLSMKQYDDEVFNGIGLIIIDEVHRTATEVFSQALMRYTFRYTLGLSATICRKDGMQKVFQWYLGKVLFKGKRKPEHVLVDNIEYFNPDTAYFREETLYNGKLNIPKMINNISEYEPRTLHIVNVVKTYINTDGEKRRKFLVLSDRKQHLRHIQSLLPKDISSGFYIGGMKPMQLAESETKDVILATYSFASEGFDAKDLDTLILATPKSDIEQSVGRILRTKEQERINVPIIIDIIDQIPYFERQYLKRYQFYKKNGYVFVNQSHKDIDKSTNVKQGFSKGVCMIKEDV